MEHTSRLIRKVTNPHLLRPPFVMIHTLDHDILCDSDSMIISMATHLKHNMDVITTSPSLHYFLFHSPCLNDQALQCKKIKCNVQLS